MTPMEKDMQEARRILGPCPGAPHCYPRLCFDRETGEPTGETYTYHGDSCREDFADDVARALAAAREEGRLAGLEWAEEKSADEYRLAREHMSAAAAWRNATDSIRAEIERARRTT